MRKLRAFTLMEMLLVLVISGIVISIGYGAYSFMGEQLGSFRASTSGDQSLNSGIAMLEFDVFKADVVTRVSDDEIIIEGKEVVRYWFKELGLVRSKEEVIDTFPMPLRSTELLFNKGNVSSSSGLIDEIRFFVQSGSENLLSICITKKYDACRLLMKVDSIRQDEQY